MFSRFRQASSLSTHIPARRALSTEAAQSSQNLTRQHSTRQKETTKKSSEFHID